MSGRAERQRERERHQLVDGQMGITTGRFIRQTERWTAQMDEKTRQTEIWTDGGKDSWSGSRTDEHDKRLMLRPNSPTIRPQ